MSSLGSPAPRSIFAARCDSIFLLCRRILHSKGELSEDRHKQYEEFATSYQKLLANTQSLADLLDENMPELPQDKTVQEGVYPEL